MMEGINLLPYTWTLQLIEQGMGCQMHYLNKWHEVEELQNNVTNGATGRYERHEFIQFAFQDSYWLDAMDIPSLRRRFVKPPKAATTKSIGIVQRRHRRVIANIDNMTIALHNAGFPIVDVQEMEDLSLVDQAAWFASHDIILAVHGGALTNAIFIRPNTAIISLYPPGYYVPGVFESLIEKAGGIAMEWHQQGDPLLRDASKMPRNERLDAMGVRFMNPPVNEIVSLVQRAAANVAK